MSAVARLLFTFFTGSQASKWLTVSGLLLILASLYVVLHLPQAEHMLAFAVPGIIAFFLGGSLMPLTVGRLAQARAAGLLPGARIKLLAAATLTVLLVALPVGLLTPLAYVAGMSADVHNLFEDPRLRDYTLWLALYTGTSACIAAAWLYVLMWFVTSERNRAGYAKAMVVLLVLLLIPAGAEQEPDARLRANLFQLAVFFVVFSAGFLAWPRLKRWYAGWRRASFSRPGRSAREFAGREIDLMLGNSRPWTLIGVLLLPLVATVRTGLGGGAFWLLYLPIASIIAGGNAERAPGRSRALWLRDEGSRSALFAVVEKSAWRHNGAVMIFLLLILLVIGSCLRMAAAQMITAFSLIVLGTTLTTYLGLSLTRGVRVSDAFLSVVVMMAMVIIAVMTANGGLYRWIVSACLAALAVLAFMLRGVARRRWSRIDWSECRGETRRPLRAG